MHTQYTCTYRPTCVHMHSSILTCTCAHMKQYSHTHMHRILHTHAWIEVQCFNASHSFRPEPLPLRSHHCVSLNRSAVTMMTWCLPFYPRAVCHLKAPPPEFMRQKHKTYDWDVNRAFSHTGVWAEMGVLRTTTERDAAKAQRWNQWGNRCKLDKGTIWRRAI